MDGIGVGRPSFDRFRANGLRIDRNGNASVVIEAAHQQRRNPDRGERHAAGQTRSRQRRTLHERAPRAPPPPRPAEPQRAASAARKEGARSLTESRGRGFLLHAPTGELQSRSVLLRHRSSGFDTRGFFVRRWSCGTAALRLFCSTPEQKAPTPEQGRATPKFFRPTPGQKHTTMAFRAPRKRPWEPPMRSRVPTAQRKASGVAGKARVPSRFRCAMLGRYFGGNG